METTTKTETVIKDFRCPKCKNGKLRPFGLTYLTNPPKYPHKCLNCGYKQTFKKRYPYVDYEINIKNMRTLRAPSNEVVKMIEAFGLDPNNLQSFVLRMKPNAAVTIETISLVNKGEVKDALEVITTKYELVSVEQDSVVVPKGNLKSNILHKI